MSRVSRMVTSGAPGPTSSPGSTCRPPPRRRWARRGWCRRWRPRPPRWRHARARPGRGRRAVSSMRAPGPGDVVGGPRRVRRLAPTSAPASASSRRWAGTTPPSSRRSRRSNVFCGVFDRVGGALPHGLGLPNLLGARAAPRLVLDRTARPSRAASAWASLARASGLSSVSTRAPRVTRWPSCTVHRQHARGDLRGDVDRRGLDLALQQPRAAGAGACGPSE